MKPTSILITSAALLTAVFAFGFRPTSPPPLAVGEPFLGEVRMFAGNFAPQGWTFCDGQLLQINQYQALYSLLGTTYGGDGFSTFGLPDLRGRVPFHSGNGPGLDPIQLGQKGGLARVTLNPAQMPSHNHGLLGHSGPGQGGIPLDRTLACTQIRGLYGAPANMPMAADAISVVGGSGAHENMPPFVGLNYIIALDGSFPSEY
jgi:microcystin-dependent protein